MTREGDFQVYNFEVEDFHTYFVSDLGLLIHNACRLEPDPNAVGNHTAFKLDNETNQIRGYPTYKEDINVKNPNLFQLEKRVDIFGAPHINKNILLVRLLLESGSRIGL